jgi:hypothetical protein
MDDFVHDDPPPAPHRRLGSLEHPSWHRFVEPVTLHPWPGATVAPAVVKPRPAPEPAEWQNGTVQRLFPDDGIGYVQPDGLGRHHTITFEIELLNLHGLAIELGQRVRFTDAADLRRPGKKLVNRIELINEG